VFRRDHALVNLTLHQAIPIPRRKLGINHGNSGGPLVDRSGDVIGINAILLTTQANEGSNGLDFAISSTAVDYVWRHLRDPASITVSWIGAHVQDATSDLAKAVGLD
jgi:serine protease Do